MRAQNDPIAAIRSMVMDICENWLRQNASTIRSPMRAWQRLVPRRCAENTRSAQHAT
jgi:hypothetical protein